MLLNDLVVQHQMSEPPRLFLITPRVGDASTFAPLLDAAMTSGADIACVLLRTAERDEGTTKAIFRTLAPLVQPRGAAFLVGQDARLAARVEADGVHIPAIGADLDEALDPLRARKIVGVGGLLSRDDAMTAGEGGVDYLMFGGPDERNDQAAIIERVSWWAEIFNVPCVGYAVAPEHAAEVARGGAEFVALCDGLWDEPATIASQLRQIAAALREPFRVLT